MPFFPVTFSQGGFRRIWRTRLVIVSVETPSDFYNFRKSLECRGAPAVVLRWKRLLRGRPPDRAVLYLRHVYASSVVWNYKTRTTARFKRIVWSLHTTFKYKYSNLPWKRLIAVKKKNRRPYRTRHVHLWLNRDCARRETRTRKSNDSGSVRSRFRNNLGSTFSLHSARSRPLFEDMCSKFLSKNRPTRLRRSVSEYFLRTRWRSDVTHSLNRSEQRPDFAVVI